MRNEGGGNINMSWRRLNCPGKLFLLPQLLPALWMNANGFIRHVQYVRFRLPSMGNNIGVSRFSASSLLRATTEPHVTLPTDQIGFPVRTLLMPCLLLDKPTFQTQVKIYFLQRITKN